MTDEVEIQTTWDDEEIALLEVLASEMYKAGKIDEPTPQKLIRYVIQDFRKKHDSM